MQRNRKISILHFKASIKYHRIYSTIKCPDPFELMMNYFGKRFVGIEKKLQQPSNKNAKIEVTFKFKHNGNRIQSEFNKQI